jgi:hypothetical protein
MKQTDMNEWKCTDKVEAVESTYVVVPEDIYQAEYLGTQRREGETNDFYMHKWCVTNRKGESNEITELSSLKLTPNTKLGQIFKALGFEVKEGESHSMEDLVGKKCQLVVKIEMRNGEKRNKITDHISI